MSVFWEFMKAHWVEVGAAFALFQAGFASIARLTKNKTDDKIAGWLGKAFAVFARKKLNK